MATDNLEFGYNLTSGGENYKRSEETCLKISDSLKGRKMSLEQKEKISITKFNKPDSRSRMVIQLDLEGNIINVYSHVNQIYNQEGYNINHIRTCCREKHGFAFGYLWVYYDDYCHAQFNIESYDNIKKPIPILQFSKDDQFICQFKSIYQASKETSISRQNIQKCISGERKSAGGYKWIKVGAQKKAQSFIWDDDKGLEMIINSYV